MKIRRMMGIVAMAVVASAGGAALSGCGESQVKFAKVAPAAMPDGESWNGVYFNQVFGFLHLEETGGSVHGKWEWKDKSRWGELTGTADGNVLTFEMTEHKKGVVGAAAETHGKGWFAYTAGADGYPHLDGEYSIDTSHDVGDWKNVKQRNMKPDLKSIKPNNELDTPATQDTWH